MMEIGNNYTRAEIAEKLGGSRIDFLPRVGRKVVCACLRMDLNPDAPEIPLSCAVRATITGAPPIWTGRIVPTDRSDSRPT